MASRLNLGAGSTKECVHVVGSSSDSIASDLRVHTAACGHDTFPQDTLKRRHNECALNATPHSIGLSVPRASRHLSGIFKLPESCCYIIPFQTEWSPKVMHSPLFSISAYCLALNIKAVKRITTCCKLLKAVTAVKLTLIEWRVNSWFKKKTSLSLCSLFCLILLTALHSESTTMFYLSHAEMLALPAFDTFSYITLAGLN